MTARERKWSKWHKSAIEAICLLLLISSLLAIPTNAIELNGRLSSEFYVWSEDDVTYARPYESLRLNAIIYRGEKVRQLSFHSFSRWATSYSGSVTGQSKFRIYDSYLRIKTFRNYADISFGRQFVYNSAGSVTIDGVRIVLRPMKKIRLDLFGGSSVNRLDTEEIRSFGDYTTLGGRLSIRVRPSIQIGINHLYQKSEAELMRHRLGIDYRHRLNRWNVYMRGTMNVVQMNLAELRSRVSFTTVKNYISVEYLKRQPSVRENSIFALIQSGDYQNFRINLRHKINSLMSLTGSARFGATDDYNTRYFSIGIAKQQWSLSIYNQTGYGTESKGITGFGQIELQPKMELYFRANLGRYKVQDLQNDLNDAYSSAIGINRRFGNGWETRFEGQYLRNAISESDTRIYLNIIKRFAIGQSGGGN